jgi:transposase
MVLNGLGFANRTRYLMPHFFVMKPVERLLGNGIKAEHHHSDVMGRALDKLYTIGVNKIYTTVAAGAVQRLGLTCRFGHLDATGFHLDGKYNSDDVPSARLVQITKGYSRDHRPALNQVVLQLISERQAGIPLLMEPLDGNNKYNSDSMRFRQTIQNHISQLRDDLKLEYLVADSALYVAKTRVEMNDFFWISRVPESLGNAQELIGNIAPDLMKTPDKMNWRTKGKQLCRSQSTLVGRFFARSLPLMPKKC